MTAAVNQDPVDHLLRVTCLGQAGDVLVERVASRQQLAAAESGVSLRWRAVGKRGRNGKRCGRKG